MLKVIIEGYFIDVLLLCLGTGLLGCQIARQSESHLCMKVIESTLIIILTAPPDPEGTG